ncbi:UvrD-helicase domain-containing protein [Klebsiella pneumoniae]|uniref:UvrD-helicase domain-containing protein n=1 Tax=Klebsiella/Raoultella group TaxID=2890311 RepID=UPI000E2D2BDD|nr:MULTISPECIES: UvrD-helicase domain-containing protein [Klebsiella]MBD7030169.1 UvrD-helicase domain-containing protein [Klebsiella pneumoniae]MCW9238084.1 UvrD-helicase domain-containing protein [Klebsiella variicola]MDF3332220.1 UvrD-helicase domain-containing protein [Klebsiella quasipneumoniae subsp. similipneumoniae]TNC59624.1 ImmA/IrrE family metallo-endopeptidase [Klebsiella quasipneumoniae]WFF21358.1 UvrD-helicase domain-containing protein [Klebsiella pneumoniae]
MQAVELARKAAAALYDRAVAAGLDPWKPYEFTVAEAGRRGFDVESTKKGSPSLRGARARFVPKGKFILHEKCATLFEQAFLVAHEIGHAELGDDVEEDDQTHYSINPTRITEASPAGAERVVDYSRRQRREVQMDLFAREFLLPRHVARTLYLNGESASSIAGRLGAPFDVVAQQIFDALLLPPPPPEVPEPAIEYPLNDEQAKAAAHRGAAFLLEAGPGTGKTQTLVGRVKGLLADGVDPRKILLLTFSNKAAGEMAERIARVNTAAAAAMWIGTFHSFGLDLVRRFHEELELPPDPRMLDRTEAVELLEHEFPGLGLVHHRNLYDPTLIIADILTGISRAKDEVVDASTYLQLAQAMRIKAVGTEDIAAAEKAIEIANVYIAYETLKRQSQCIDFGDLVSLPVKLLEENEAIRSHIQSTYDHVLVDEYQDVNHSSVRLLKALCGDGENLWVVGDAKQSIYRFRGASSFNMTCFGNKDFPGGLRHRLKMNYRSVPEIVSTFSSFALGMAVGDADSGLRPYRKENTHQPELRCVDQGSQQTPAIADAVKEMLESGFKYSDQAILCTGNDKLSDIGQQLERLGIPVLYLGSVFERPEIKDWLALLSLLVDRRAMGLVRMACLPEFTMSLEDVGSILTHLREDETEGDWITKVEDFDISDNSREALYRLVKTLKGFNGDSSPWSLLAEVLLDRTRIAARMATSKECSDRSRCIATWQLLNFLRNQHPTGEGLFVARTLDRIRRLVRLGDDRDLRQLPEAAQSIDAVRLMTIHGAKGLEFPVVHIPGMNADTLPGYQKKQVCPPPDGMITGEDNDGKEQYQLEHKAERECLFYVALSRAEDRLFLYATTRNSAGYNRKTSDFLNRVGPDLINKNVVPLHPVIKPPESLPVDWAVSGEFILSGAQISLYESCPRRFFYTHILQIGGRRTPTPFLKMHDAVRKVFQNLVDAAPFSATNIEERVVQALMVEGLADHGYAKEFKSLAIDMIRYFTSIRDGHTSEKCGVLSMKIGKIPITVQPDDVLVRSDGRRMFRRVRTGHKRDNEESDLGAAAFVLAARQAFPDAIVELVHLSDKAVLPIELSTKKLENRQKNLQIALDSIGRGVFPAESSSRVCPSCPAFFICGLIPTGVLQKKI